MGPGFESLRVYKISKQNDVIPCISFKYKGFFGQINNMVYGGMGKPTLVEDWLKTNVADVYFPGLKSFDVFGKFQVNPWAWTNNLTKDCIFSALKAVEGPVVVGPIRKNVTAADPKMALHFNGNGSTVQSYVTGIQSYGARESKTVRFSQAGGFSISVGGAPVGYLPETFTIENTRIFGAVKFNGVWKGIRFYKN